MLTTKSSCLLDTFHLAAGSITGRRHLGSANLLAGRNNQDSFSCRLVEGCFFLGVFDGCSSAPYSELGARLAASVTPAAVSAVLKNEGANSIDQPDFWDMVLEEILRRFSLIASVCSGVQVADLRSLSSLSSSSSNGEFEAFIRNHFLFTVLAALVSPQKTVVVGMGDGVFVINRVLSCIGPFPDNAPDYLGEALLGQNIERAFCLHASLETAELDTLVLGTDGVVDLVANAETCLPGKLRKVGSLDQLFEQHSLFTPMSDSSSNENESLSGWLRLVNSEVVHLRTAEDGGARLHRERGLLADDTTLLALRRVKAQGGLL